MREHQPKAFVLISIRLWSLRGKGFERICLSDFFFQEMLDEGLESCEKWHPLINSLAARVAVT